MDEDTISTIRKVIRVIHKMNLMGVPIQVEDILFNIDRKEQTKKGCFRCSKKRHFVEDCPNNTTSKDKKKKCKTKYLLTIKTWDDSSSEDEFQHTRYNHNRSTPCSSHKCIMAQGNIKYSSSS
jgi:hypothetical protein